MYSFGTKSGKLSGTNVDDFDDDSIVDSQQTQSSEVLGSSQRLSSTQGRRRGRKKFPRRRRPLHQLPIYAEDDIYRRINEVLPNQIQYLLRDLGAVRWILNCLVAVGIPSLLQSQPTAIHDILQLWFGTNINEMFRQEPNISDQDRRQQRRQTIRYGDHPRQVIEWWDASFMTEESTEHATVSHSSNLSDETIIFVHGGAWGTGYPFLYLLVAMPFLRLQRYNVAIVGYRTYPDASATMQAQDVSKAINTIRRRQQQQQQDPSDESHTYTLIAHSSGAHICSLAMVRGWMSTSTSTSTTTTTTIGTNTDTDQNHHHDVPSSSSSCMVDRFISLSGIFDIRQHYKIELSRGIARFSPMAAACCYSLPIDSSLPTSSISGSPTTTTTIFQQWRDHSPLNILQDMTHDLDDNKHKFESNKEFFFPIPQSTMSGGSRHDRDNDNDNDTEIPNDTSNACFPSQILLVHSMDDTTCPYWYSQDFGQELQNYQNNVLKVVGNRMNTNNSNNANDSDNPQKRNNDNDDDGTSIQGQDVYNSNSNNDDNDKNILNFMNVDVELLQSSGHAEMVTELMFGGPVQDLVLDWIQDRGRRPN